MGDRGDSALELLPATALQAMATITDGPGGLAVVLGTRRYPVRPAFGCLIEPIAGDRALVAIDPTDTAGTAYVVSVLERHAGEPARLSFPGDARIHAPAGSIAFDARDGIAFASPGKVDLLAGALQVQAREAEISIDRATYSGTLLRACITGIKLAATTFDAMLDRCTQRMRTSLRRVEELEQVHAQQIDYQARDTMALHGQNTLMTAERLVKVDGASIHVG